MNKALLSLLLIFSIAGCRQQRSVKSEVSASPASTPSSGPFSEPELQQFASLEPIDTHSHIFQNSPAYVAMLRKFHMHVLDILVDDDLSAPPFNNFAVEREDAWQVVRGSHGDVSLCTTFDPYRWSQPDFSRQAIREINHEFDQGAIAVKIWKNIGMEIKAKKGNYLMPDNPVFEPIYRDIAEHNKTLIAHVADPNSAWEPPNPASPDYSYYKANPAWYMYGKPHPASKEEILRTRDHLLEQNPKLRVVGAHLGSMESDFSQLAADLDRYPNFAVDMAARMPYLEMQPRATMIAFISKYQDRLIYATDDELRPGEDAQTGVSRLEHNYARDWRYLATSDTLDDNGRTIQALNLPLSVLRKLYHDNAVKWFPGIQSSAQ